MQRFSLLRVSLVLNSPLGDKTRTIGIWQVKRAEARDLILCKPSLYFLPSGNVQCINNKDTTYTQLHMKLTTAAEYTGKVNWEHASKTTSYSLLTHCIDSNWETDKKRKGCPYLIRLLISCGYCQALNPCLVLIIVILSIIFPPCKKKKCWCVYDPDRYGHVGDHNNSISAFSMGSGFWRKPPD